MGLRDNQVKGGTHRIGHEGSEDGGRPWTLGAAAALVVAGVYAEGLTVQNPIVPMLVVVFAFLVFLLAGGWALFRYPNSPKR